MDEAEALSRGTVWQGGVEHTERVCVVGTQPHHRVKLPESLTDRGLISAHVELPGQRAFKTHEAFGSWRRDQTRDKKEFRSDELQQREARI